MDSHAPNPPPENRGKSADGAEDPSPFLSPRSLLFDVRAGFGRLVCGQNEGPVPQPHNWDLGVWAAAATGEENTNSLAEAQTLTGGVSVGKVLTGEIGKGWRRGRFEYGMDFIPLFRQFRPHEVHGMGFEPVILRWNSDLHTRNLSPYIELAGEVYIPTLIFPQAILQTLTFPRGGGGLRIFTKPS